MAVPSHDLAKAAAVDPNVYRIESRDAKGGPEVSAVHVPTRTTVATAQFTPQLKFVDHDHDVGCPKCEAEIHPGQGIGAYHSEPEAWKPWMVEVHPDHRRKGLATAMYQHLQEKTGLPILNGSVQTPDGEAFRGTGLAKSISPDHLGAVAGATDTAGAALVDHAPDLVPHPAVAEGAQTYRDHILNSPKPVGRKGASGSGITKKAVFQVKDPKDKGGLDVARYMVKPYHERVITRVKKWMKYPIQGWAELTNQALFHAGGIGHLHQAVHADEHDMGRGHEKEPALVVKLADDHVPIAEGGANHFGGEENRADLRKIAVMDFLANNHDRHGGNLMIGKLTAGSSNRGRPLAIDHSRNFQYIAPRQSGKLKGPSKYGDMGDQFGPYVIDSSINNAEPLINRAAHKDSYSAQMDAMERYAPAIEWWGEAGPKIRQTFHERLNQIKDPEVKEHLARNFDARADWLDERSRFGLENYGTDWYKDDVPMYRPGELTDDEKNDPEVVQRQADRQMATKKLMQAAKQRKKDEKAKQKVHDDWRNAQPRYPHHLGGMERVEREAHPDWKKYAEEWKQWEGRKPEVK